MKVERIEPRWSGLVVVAATGPSLTPEVAELCRGRRVIAVNDAYRLIPWAEVLYAADHKWWDVHNGCSDFAGEKWTTYQECRRAIVVPRIRQHKLRVCLGDKKETFSLDPKLIHYGRNSGFQAINLALLWGGNPIVLVGFNFQVINKRRHFFGEHPRQLYSASNYPEWVKTMRKAAKALPPNLSIINCTPNSAIDCFPVRDLKEVLDGAEINHAA